MSAPKILIQIVIVGAQIFGRALAAAGKQAVQNAKHRPQGAVSGDAAGVGHATSGSVTDRLTREHRMTMDEAHLILNAKRGDAIENILRNYEHLYKANSPPSPPAAPPPPSGRQASLPSHSHYLQSKVFRARERIEAELRVAEEEAPVPPPPGSEGGHPPPPPGGS